MEADFLRFYNLDLNEIHKNNLISWRKFLILIKGLPEDSAYNNFYHNRKDDRSFIERQENQIERNIKQIGN